MYWVVIVVALGTWWVSIFIAVHIARRAFQSRRSTIKVEKYRVVEPLSNSDRAFFRFLSSTLPGHRVFVHVAVTAFLCPRRTATAPDAELHSLTVNFLVCNSDLSLAAVVELRDPKRDTPERSKRIRQIDWLMRTFDIPMICWDCSRIPTAGAIRKQFEEWAAYNDG